jgi:hypothetical protein
VSDQVHHLADDCVPDSTEHMRALGFEAECPTCGGQGWTTGSAHDPRCDGSCRNCPIPVQEQCEFCDGAGYFVPVSA